MALGLNDLRRRGRGLRLAAAAAAAMLCASGCSDEGADLDTNISELSPQEEANIAVATRVIEQGLGAADVSVIEQLVRADLIQHSAQVGEGREGWLEQVASTGGVVVKIHRKLASGNFVAFHSTYGEGPSRIVAFNVFRLQRGQVAEHWDALQRWVEPGATVSGNTLVDGTETVRDRHLTDANRELVTRMVREVFMEGRVERLADYIGSSYIQHNPRADNGLASVQAFYAAVKAQGVLAYTASPLVVADGNFVLVGSEGYLGQVSDYTLFYDLFRVNGGKIVEHWDVIQAVNPSSVPHDNGLFGAGTAGAP